MKAKVQRESKLEESEIQLEPSSIFQPWRQRQELDSVGFHELLAHGVVEHRLVGHHAKLQ